MKKNAPFSSLKSVRVKNEGEGLGKEGAEHILSLEATAAALLMVTVILIIAVAWSTCSRGRYSRHHCRIHRRHASLVQNLLSVTASNMFEISGPAD